MHCYYQKTLGLVCTDGIHASACLMELSQQLCVGVFTKKRLHHANADVTGKERMMKE